jgi:hypothetical protein
MSGIMLGTEFKDQILNNELPTIERSCHYLYVNLPQNWNDRLIRFMRASGGCQS